MNSARPEIPGVGPIGQAIYAMCVVRTLVPRRYGPSRPRLLTTLKNSRTRALAEASAIQNRRPTIPRCPAQPSDLYPRALRFPTDKRRVFHLSATSAFIGLRLEPRRLCMASKEEMSIKRTIRRQRLRELVPLADSTIYEMEQRGEFPRRFALSPRCVVWDLSEVEAWLATRRSAPIARAQHPDVTQRRSRPVKAPGRAPRAASTVE
jgi:prophage regulatory protein